MMVSFLLHRCQRDVRLAPLVRFLLGAIDACNDAHGGASVGGFERIDLLNFLIQSGPVDVATCIDGRLVAGTFCAAFIHGPNGCASALTVARVAELLLACHPINHSRGIAIVRVEFE